MGIAQLSTNEVMGDAKEKAFLVTLPEIKIVLRIVQFLAWVNLLIGLPSVFLMLSMHSLSLVATGMLSLLTFWLLQLVVNHIKQTKSWMEVGTLAMCGIYFPAFVIWLSGMNLLGAILK